MTCVPALSVTQCRKYDLEQEARTLYGESLKTLMQRFRRTAEYLAILNDEPWQVVQMQKRLEAVGDRTAYVYALQLYDQVVLEIGGNVTSLRAGALRPPG
ncbi:jg13765 [Pararge aegeria aegeria]|uniref:Jg13765 protein n=1 Tax=Pararge aegeria aegeria TaxID=348720 RepID=A0A8S4QRI9_9NEOP|nr:jg13765 [Pararge aegeria aegeria]